MYTQGALEQFENQERPDIYEIIPEEKFEQIRENTQILEAENIEISEAKNEKIVEEPKQNKEEFDQYVQASEILGNEIIVYDRQEQIKTIGKINIPKIDLELPIFKGVQDQEIIDRTGTDSMNWGASTNLQNQKMRVGNYVLSSHRSKRPILFTRIHELSKGDLIYLSDGHKQYTYQVFQNFNVKPNETWILNSVLINDKKADIVTLYTCLNYNDSSERTVIRGLLINIQDIY